MPVLNCSPVPTWKLLINRSMHWLGMSGRSSVVPTLFRPAQAGNVMRGRWFALLTAVVSLDTGASAIHGINHTDLSISQFSVNGRSGIDVIGPFQGGGGGCCYVVPKHWQPGMTVAVDWQKGAGAGSSLSKEFPGFADEAKYDEWLDKLEAQRRRHSRIIPVPDYTGQKACGITVHFLPCDEVQVTTSCFSFGAPEYPIKAALKAQEAQACPT